MLLHRRLGMKSRRAWRRTARASLLDESAMTDEPGTRAALLDAIRRLVLEEHFRRPTVKRADDIARRPDRWRPPVAWYRPEGSRAEALQGQYVEPGESVTTATVYIFNSLGTSTVASTCTCGLPLCAHAAALLLRIQRLIDWPRQLTPWQAWQQQVQELLSNQPKPARRPKQAAHALCVVQPSRTGQPQHLEVSFVLARSRADADHPERWLPIGSAAEDLRVPASVFQWQAKLRALGGQSESSQGAYQLHGSTGRSLLREWLGAGICRHAWTGVVVRDGPSREPRFEWQLDSTGRYQLETSVSSGDSAGAIDLEGLHYLDELSGEFGELTMSIGLWNLLQRIPALGGAEREALGDWPPHPLLANVPPPPPLQPVRDLTEPLVVVLQVTASRNRDRSAFAFYVHPWADYAGIRIPLNQHPWQARVIRRVNGETCSICRDLSGEQMISARILTHLAPLHQLLPDTVGRLEPVPSADALAHREHGWGGPDVLIALDRALQCLTNPYTRIEYDPHLPFVILAKETPVAAALAPSEKSGWTQFQLTIRDDHGNLDILPLLLKAVRSGAFPLTPSAGEPSDARLLLPLGPV